ncbi:MAG: Wzz/FepE/Etk N-terminal domain-containing protein [Candidatus Falkowbacteria bacterium]|nr:Wzz/FepE/Etk N-terminal domain-containing protein [Candidatus Falkowbacteria bacterium]
MELHDFINLVARKRKTIFGIVAIFILLGIGVIAVQRFKYSSKSQLLVVQEYNQNIDAYTASKSNEYLSNVLASVVSSNSFFTKVLESGFDIDASYFGDNPKDQMKQWQKTVSAKSINDSGIIAITAYHPNRDQAEKIDRAINYVLMTQNTAYHGSGDAVKVRLIDQPITSSYPVKPNIFLTLGIAIALGFIAGLVYVYLTPLTKLPSAHYYGEHAKHVHADQLASVRSHGQFPVEAFDNILIDNDLIGEGGYNDEIENIPSAEELARQASMRNILR